MLEMWMFVDVNINGFLWCYSPPKKEKEKMFLRMLNKYIVLQEIIPSFIDLWSFSVIG
jgi:hypothetical protein